jgi:hypothetical protein
MSTSPKKPAISELPVTQAEFLKLYNATLPSIFPRATTPLLNKYKAEHESFFKNGDLWSVDLHRKKVMDWLPNNLKK